MVARIQKGLITRPLRTAALLLVAVALAMVAVGLAASAVRLAVFTVGARDFPAAVSRDMTDEAIVHFPFRGRTRFVRVAIDPAEVSAAEKLDTSRVFSSIGPVRETYIRTLVDAASRSGTVDRIASDLRSIRADLALDDDAYLELIARFVQEIPYGTVDNEVRLPVEVVADGSGACDDKSVLLASLLVHEGYNTAIWTFDSQAHAAVGVRCLGPGMLGSGYAFIETTVPAYVGQVGGTLGSFARWRRSPDLVEVGGTRLYTADLESAFVASALERARWSARELRPYVTRARKAPSRWRDAYVAAAKRQASAQELASLLVFARDDRARLFALLTQSGAR